MSKETVTEYFVPVEVRPDEVSKAVFVTLQGQCFPVVAGFHSAEEVWNFCETLIEAACVIWKDDEGVKEYLLMKKEGG